MSDYITPQQLEQWIGVKTATLANWRYRGTGPEFIKAGAKRVLYSTESVEAWLKANTRTMTGDAA